MNRAEWLELKRHSCEERYDRLWSPIYDDNWGSTISPIHAGFVIRLANLCPRNGMLLDAACGTGKYWPILLASEKAFCGIDQSQGMLDIAHAKFPQVKVAKLSLQDMRYQNAFDAILCIDAMEMVFPEDWPLVMGNFYRALKHEGQLYLTVEIADQESIEQDYRAGLEIGLPIIWGESVYATGDAEEDGGYHYYPAMEQVRKWIDEAAFVIQAEAEGEDYHHFWVKKGGKNDCKKI